MFKQIGPALLALTLAAQTGQIRVAGNAATGKSIFEGKGVVVHAIPSEIVAPAWGRIWAISVSGVPQNRCGYR